MSNERIGSYPYKMHARACATEYLDCKTEAQPIAHHLNQVLAGYRREYVRLMILVFNPKGKVSRIVYAHRYISSAFEFGKPVAISGKAFGSSQSGPS